MTPAPSLRDQLLVAIQHQQAGELAQAARIYQQILSNQPQQPDALHLLGVIRFQQGDSAQARQLIQQAIAAQPTALYFLNLGIVEETEGGLTAAAAAYQAALQLQPDYPWAQQGLARIHQEQNQLEVARQLYEDLLQRHPDDLETRVRRDLMLPVFYEDTEEIERFRAQFSQNLSQLIRDVDLTDPQSRARALAAVRSFPNFYLSYQGKNDLELKCQFGEFLHQVMSKNFPQWSIPPQIPAVETQIRIGYVSAFMGNHTVGKLILGWLRYHDRQGFEIYSYHVGQIWDGWTEAFQKQSDRFYYLPSQLEAACHQIHQDRLHILVFLDIGMNALTGMIAALRLAPIQCTTWTHPVTTGIPSVDYFLSSDLMEPEDGESHYSETLIRLPNLSITYHQPTLPTGHCSRSDLGLPEDRILYLCCQSLFKYLPQHDFIFAEIARQVPEALFVFLSYREDGAERVDQQLRSRFQRAFESVGLEGQAFLQQLPRLSWHNYLQLNLLSDIYLDSFLWSGGNTTLEAVACGLPIVTCPGPLMRGRHTYAILQQLRIPETIAQDEGSYIEIAVTLGQDPDYRQQIRQRVLAAKHRVFEDVTPVRALEQFYRESVRALGSSIEGAG